MKFKRDLRSLDKKLLFLVLIFLAFGLLMIFSASSISATQQYKQTEYFFFRKQILLEILALCIGFVIIFVPLSKYKYPSFLFVLGIIFIMSMLKPYGIVTNSARSWITLPGGFSIQPSEFAKTAIILFLACSYGSKKKIKNIQDLLIPLIPCVIIVGLVASEPDLGTALIITSITALIFFALPIEKNKIIKLLKTLTAIAIGLTIIFISNASSFLTESQASRLTFYNPCSRYLEETGYQVCNGYIAINNGGIFGVGLGNSMQKYLYLPEAHTDFIFPIIVEELGLIGGFLVLIAYILVLYRLLIIAVNAGNLTGSIIAFGTFSYLLSHIIVNVGGLLALIPLTGVPLPFLSYGGSYIINIIILIALSERVAIESKQTKEKREFREALGD